MDMIRIAILTASFAYLVAGGTVIASVQSAPPAQASQTPPSAASGKDVLQRKCFQCHPPTMWTSVRGDRRMWLGVLHRMVGRGALWTEDEINAMADFLAETRGSK